MKAVFLKQFARIGKALASPSRLELIDLLCQSEKTVETLVSQSNLTLKNASAQLKVLREAGLVKARKDGKYVYYSISDEKVAAFWSNLQDFSSRQLADLQHIAAKLVNEPGELIAIDRKELLKRARKEEIIVLDVRPHDEYSAAHLPYAISLPLDELKAKLKQIPKDKEIVAYCRGPYCLMAVEAVRFLKSKGYKAVRLDDGVQEWKASGLPIHVGRLANMALLRKGNRLSIQPVRKAEFDYILKRGGGLN
jgi:rhodanese-related sulfurtransferase/predicted transcriptional regulator